MAEPGAPQWKVVGGEDKGGILVRSGPKLSSPAEKERLSTGALVEQLEEPVESRLRYRLLQGTGPREGWVAIRLQGGKELVVPRTPPPPAEPWDGVVPAAFANPGFEGVAQGFQPLSEELFDGLPKPRQQQRLSVKQLGAVCEQNLPGEFHGLSFPHNPEQIQEWGPQWLTTAFHKAGTLPEDVSVTEFTFFRVLAADTTKVTDNEDDGSWGGAGIKVMVSVAYSRGVDEVTQDFFIKIPHKLGNKSERHKISIVLNNDFPEVMFNTICASSVPFRSPKCYFADINRDTTNFIVICERIPYGSRDQEVFKPYEVLPAPGKYVDYQLEGNGADYYYAQAKAFARMAAWYQRSLEASQQLDYLFMVKEDADGFLWGMWEQLEHLGSIEGRVERVCEYFRQQGREAVLELAAREGTNVLPEQVAKPFLEIGMDFMETCHAVFPAGVLTPEFKEQFQREVSECIKYSTVANWWVYKIWPELMVLAHPNLQVDNAFYWRDGEGRMQAGLLDWGSVTHNTIPMVLASGWHSAEIGVMDEHEDQLACWFVDQMLEAGGKCCDKETFLEMIKLSRTMIVCGMFTNLHKLYQLCPKTEWPSITGRMDQRIQKAFLVRCYSIGPMMTISGWKSRNPMQYLRGFLKRLGVID